MTRPGGDADIASVAALIADRGRAHMLLALTDGRALPASVLAAEAGVAPSTASSHLARLLDAGLVSVHSQGRHRYYRLRDGDVAELIESLARLAPTFEIRSLRQGTRAQALRRARTCYDHLAGRLGVALCRALIEAGAITGGDGVHRPESARGDRLSSAGGDIAYTLTPAGQMHLARIGVGLPEPSADGQVALRYCVDWTEQRHHISGAVGRALATRLVELRWIERDRHSRAVRLTAAGEAELPRAFGERVLD
ncbi:MAG: ArsR/SmtB family transcription factor [Solirubrobacteraceae bacterium]